MNGLATLSSVQVVASFQQSVIDRFQITVDTQQCNYQQSLTIPESKRNGDEANAVDQQFARYVLEWLGFSATDWTYNQPQSDQKANRPDYLVNGSVGTAFIWEDKNSTHNLELATARDGGCRNLARYL